MDKAAAFISGMVELTDPDEAEDLGSSPSGGTFAAYIWILGGTVTRVA